MKTPEETPRDYTFGLLLGKFARLRKMASSCLSVHCSTWNNLDPTGWNFHEISHWTCLL